MDDVVTGLLGIASGVVVTYVAAASLLRSALTRDVGTRRTAPLPDS
jgi:hypothetical protein